MQNTNQENHFVISTDVTRALAMHQPVVALESTVITHGLPYPENLNLARNMEETVRAQGAVPATVAVLDGQILIGVNDLQLERLAQATGMLKISTRDFAPAIAQRLSGGTTVAGTMLAASHAGIRVFATGGIGGVHRRMAGVPGSDFDISTDLTQLARIPMVVVCAGAKAILDLPATLEVLDTYGVPVVGYGSPYFPAFYSRSSGLKTSACVERPEEAANIARAHWGLGQQTAVLVTVPPPEGAALKNEEVEGAIHAALAELEAKKVRGQEVTPYLLSRVSELTKGASLQVNLALLLNNAGVAAQIAQYLR